MTKAETRAAMPLTSAIIDEVRSLFGDPAGVLATENGHTVRWPKTYAPRTGVTIEAKPFVNRRKP